MSNDNHLRNLPVPFFSQRQNDYTLKTYYFDGEEDENGTIHSSSDVKAEISMDCRTCNITSVVMVMKYLGLTGIKRTVGDTVFTTPTTLNEFLTVSFDHEYDSLFTNDKVHGTVNAFFEIQEM